MIVASLLFSACSSIHYPVPISTDKRFVIGTTDTNAIYDSDKPRSVFLTQQQALQYSTVSETRVAIRLLESDGSFSLRNELIIDHPLRDFACREDKPVLVYSVERGDSAYFYEKRIDKATLTVSADSTFLVAFPNRDNSTVVRPTTGCGYAIVSECEPDDDVILNVHGRRHSVLTFVVYSPILRKVDSLSFFAPKRETKSAVHLDPVSLSVIVAIVRDSALPNGNLNSHRVLEVGGSTSAVSSRPPWRYRELFADSAGGDETSYRRTVLSTDLLASKIIMFMNASGSGTRRIRIHDISTGTATLVTDKTFSQDECDRIAGDDDFEDYYPRWMEPYEGGHLVLLENASFLGGGPAPSYQSYMMSRPVSVPVFRYTSIPSTSDLRKSTGQTRTTAFVLLRLRADGSIAWRTEINRNVERTRTSWSGLNEGVENLSALISKPVDNVLHIAWRDFISNSLMLAEIDLTKGSKSESTVLGQIDASACWFGMQWAAPNSYFGMTQASSSHPLVPFRVDLRRQE